MGNVIDDEAHSSHVIFDIQLNKLVANEFSIQLQSRNT